MLSWFLWRLARIVVLICVSCALTLALWRRYQARQLRRELQRRRLRDLYAWRERS